MDSPRLSPPADLLIRLDALLEREQGDPASRVTRDDVQTCRMRLVSQPTNGLRFRGAGQVSPPRAPPCLRGL